MTKRRDLVAELPAAGLVSKGGTKHETFVHPQTGSLTRVPRHREIDDGLAQAIRRQAGINARHGTDGTQRPRS